MGKSSEVEAPDNPYAQKQAKFAKQIFQETTPLRQALTSQAMDFISGNYDPSTMPTYAPLYSLGRAGLESQYNRAQENVISNTPSGGGLTGALAQLEAGRAKDVGSLPAQISQGIVQDLANKAYGIGWNTPQTAMGGMGQAAGTMQSGINSAMAAQAQQNAASSVSMGSLGMGLGSLLAMGMTGGLAAPAALGTMGGKGGAGLAPIAGGAGSLYTPSGYAVGGLMGG